jgi:phosphate transport system substrate-binding protein
MGFIGSTGPLKQQTNRMKSSLGKVISVLIFIAFVCGCNSINKDPFADTPTSGKITIGADETFRKIIDAELGVFKMIYGYAEINPFYVPERELFSRLIADSCHLIVASRYLDNSEIQKFNERKIFPKQSKIATDGIALIVNQNNSTQVISLKQLSQIFTGEIIHWDELPGKDKSGDITIVFDNQESSILRMVIDSLCTPKPLTKHAFAMQFNQDVISYVSRTPGALGLIGVSWISDRDDTLQLSFLKQVNVLAVSRDSIAGTENSYKPFQAYLAQNLYPLTRDIIMINTEPRNGLATGFSAFMASDKGQRILLKTGVLPGIAVTRLVNVREDL